MRRGGLAGRARPRRRRSLARRLLDIALAAVVLLSLAVVVGRELPGGAETAGGFARVADGDSLAIGTLRIRLEGIDAPELTQTCMRGGVEWPCGRAAKDALARLVGDGEVACEGRGRDRYGRLLARCAGAGVDLAGAMVEEGWALAYGGYEAAEADARRAGRGLWAGTFERPQDWRRIHGGLAEEPHGGFLAWLRALWRGAAVE